MTPRRNGATTFPGLQKKLKGETKYRNTHFKIQEIIDSLECGQSVQSIQRIDQAKYFKYYRLKKFMNELENNRYLSEDFFAFINTLIFNNKQDDTISSIQRKKEKSKYKKNYKKLLTILGSLEDGEIPKSLRRKININIFNIINWSRL